MFSASNRFFILNVTFADLYQITMNKEAGKFTLT